ncbi:MAG: glycosyltransferase family 39 protein, partial [Paracoccaceae bacterium]|nr:glycosyltransferase family 39 protein [Paracoccaceae bacterium]
MKNLTLAALLFGVTVVIMVLLRPLMPIDETRYLTVAWEMWQGGSKFVPHLNGDLYSHKPPLLFWLVNAVWAVLGVSETAARLVGPGFGLLSVGLTAVLARQLWPDDAARAGHGALILGTSGVFLLFGSATMFDAMLAAAVLLGMIAIFRMRTDVGAGALPVVGLAFSLALGVLAKGPVILLHVLPVALLIPLWADRDTRPGLRGWYGRVALAVLGALVLVGLWLGPALVLGGAEYREDVLWRQSAGRMVDSFAHRKPFWFFLALMPLFLWPWGWCRPVLASLAPARLRGAEPMRFLLVWGLAALIGFSLVSGKQAHYLVPELPALALLLSAGVPQGETARLRRLWLLIPTFAIFALGLAVAFG